MRRAGRGRTSAALWPEKYDEAALANIRANIGEYDWSALYDGRPVPREGALFKVSQLQIVDAPPAGMREWRAWDEASTASGGDWTAGVRIGANGDGLFYIVDVKRGQWDPDERNRTERLTAELDGASRRRPRIWPQDAARKTGEER